jgi:hypothetical protein
MWPRCRIGWAVTHGSESRSHCRTNRILVSICNRCLENFCIFLNNFACDTLASRYTRRC